MTKKDKKKKQEAAVKEEFKTLKIADVLPNPEQPRKRFDPEEDQLMADSIVLKGQIKPVDVRPLANGKYELVDGERRYRALKLLGRKEIKAIIKPDVKTRQEAVLQANRVKKYQMHARRYIFSILLSYYQSASLSNSCFPLGVR